MKRAIFDTLLAISFVAVLCVVGASQPPQSPYERRGYKTPSCEAGDIFVSDKEAKDIQSERERKKAAEDDDGYDGSGVWFKPKAKSDDSAKKPDQRKVRRVEINGKVYRPQWVVRVQIGRESAIVNADEPDGRDRNYEPKDAFIILVPEDRYGTENPDLKIEKIGRGQ